MSVVRLRLGRDQFKPHSKLDYKLESLETHETSRHHRQNDGETGVNFAS